LNVVFKDRPAFLVPFGKYAGMSFDHSRRGNYSPASLAMMTAE
jgi:hypothetical protein